MPVCHKIKVHQVNQFYWAYLQFLSRQRNILHTHSVGWKIPIIFWPWLTHVCGPYCLTRARHPWPVSAKDPSRRTKECCCTAARHHLRPGESWLPQKFLLELENAKTGSSSGSGGGSTDVVQSESCISQINEQNYLLRTTHYFEWSSGYADMTWTGHCKMSCLGMLINS